MSLPNRGALYGNRYRVIVTTDIGGSDPDDFQSMVHYLLYSDMFETEGLISSAWGNGRTSDILKVIDVYEKDYSRLRQYSKHYPTPEYLRSITKQGAIDIAPYKGYSQSTPGSQLIVECAKKEDDRPLYILVWGLLEDVAQALHDAPEILGKLRVNYIGGPNKKWGLNAYEYIVREFPDLWIIEDNSTYRGWFNGGNMDCDLGNHSFVMEHIKNHGALGDFFAEKLDGVIKMGDTPTVTYLLDGTPENPENNSLGGRFERVRNRPHRTYYRNTTREDVIEIFEVIEFVFSGPVLDVTEEWEYSPAFYLVVQNQKFDGFYCGAGQYKVRFMPKSVGEWEYVLESDIPELNGQKGEFISIPEAKENRAENGQKLKNWWADILDPDWTEGEHMGAKTINQYREVYLKDFADRFNRCLPGVAGHSYTEWMQICCSTILKGNIVENGWSYANGVIMTSLQLVQDIENDDRYITFMKSYIDQYIDENGDISEISKYSANVDRLCNGKIIFLVNQHIKEERYDKALHLIRDRISNHLRLDNSRGFAHKQIYENQMWLDGLYMLQPLYAQFAKEWNTPDDFADIAEQFRLISTYCYDEEKELFYHAYDHSKTMFWANKENGHSPHFWGRAMGWLGMAAVDVLDFFPEQHKDRKYILDIIQKIAKGILRYQNIDGLWYQILDQGTRQGNYQEASCSCMFAYFLKKSMQNGYLEHEYEIVLNRAMEGIFKRFVTLDSNGVMHICGTCQVAGLGPKDNLKRNGSFEYYISEPIVDDDAKAFGALMGVLALMAKDEMEVRYKL